MSPAESRTGSGHAVAGLCVVAGLSALSAQTFLLRELVAALSGDETGLGIGFGAWLMGIAVGALVARRVPPGATGPFLALLVSAAPLGILALRSLTVAWAPAPGELTGFLHALGLSAAVLTPSGALVGLTFTLLVAMTRAGESEASRGVGSVYVYEALGFFAGGVVLTFGVIPVFDPLAGAALVASTAGVLLAAGLSVGRRWRDLSWAGVAVVLAAALFAAAPVLERWTQERVLQSRVAGLNLVAVEHTPFEQIVLARSGDGEPLHLYRGGRYVASIPDPAEHESQAHMLASLAAAPRRVLVHGNLHLGPLKHLLGHGVEQLDLVITDRQGFEFLRPHLPPEDVAALDDRRVRLIFEDPRPLLSRQTQTYDLVVIQSGAPETLLSARLASVEFYRLVARRLSSTGALVVALPLPPNQLEGVQAELAATLFRALRDVFPVVRAAPGSAGFLLAGHDPDAVTLHPQVLASRFSSRRIETATFAGQLFESLLPPDRCREFSAGLQQLALTVPPSRDAQPVSLAYALALRARVTGSLWFWKSGSYPRGLLLLMALVPSLGILGFCTLAGRAGSESVRSTAILHLVSVTGAAGMAWWILLAFSFQLKAGALYGAIGGISALFMAGVVVGGLLGRRLGPGAQGLLRAGIIAGAYGSGLALALEFDLIPATAPGSFLLLAHGLALAIAGGVTGLVFPAAAVALSGPVDRRERTAALVEAADHGGAALAALVGAVVLVPLLGLVGSGFLVAALLGVAILALMVCCRR